MFDDDVAAVTPQHHSSFEDELRRLLDSVRPVSVTLTVPAVQVELTEEFFHRPPRPADTTDADADAGFLPGALAWDAQFAAGAAALEEVREASADIGRAEARRARGLAGVSEWAVDEVAVGLSTTSEAASVLLVQSLRLVEALPATLTALEEGRISWAHVRVLTDWVAPIRDEAVRAEAERRLLARVAGKTHTQLRDAAPRVVTRLDAAAITERITAAARERGVRLFPGEDAMSTLAAVLPLPVARAVHDALAQYAEAAAGPGDQRTTAQRMADCLVDLVLRPAEHGLTPVQARLTIVAPVRTLLGGDEPGEVDGDLIPAAMVRDLATALGLIPAEDQPAGAQDSECDTTPDSATARLPALADLLGRRSLAGTALARRPHLALLDADTGALACYTDAAGLTAAARAGRGLGPPPPSPGHRPSTALDAFVRHRDRRCRFPGCRTRATRSDLDHTTPWPAGPTTAANLHALCRHHHRLRHQAPGWQLHTHPDGALHWTTPTGQTSTTHPADPGTAPASTAPPSTAPPCPDDDRPPF